MKSCEISSSIQHIEDLPIGDFINVVEDLGTSHVTEKIDGSEILAGLDENGFYTSRESKGGKRIYSYEDYDNRFASTYKKTAHKILECALPFLKSAGLKIGDQFECEVLYGEIPNVVPYNPNLNYIIFLRRTAGAVNLFSLQEELNNKVFRTKIDIPFTEDGKTIQIISESNKWKFAKVPQINFVVESSIQLHLEKIKTYLNKKSAINNLSNSIIESTALNKCPEWCELPDWKIYKDIVKEERSKIRNILEQNKLYIKDLLLNFVRKQSSKFGPLLEEGGWIEGVVVRHPSGKVCKIVDKDTFGTARLSAWNIRNSLTENVKGVNNSTDLSFLGSILMEMASSLNHPMLATIHARQYLEKTNIFENKINFRSVKEHWLNLFENKTISLDNKLSDYIQNNVPYSNIERAVHKRTLQTFAETFDILNNFSMKTNQSINIKDLFNILVEKYQ